MLLDYLKENYKEGEPIFVSDLSFDNFSKSALTQRLNTLCKNGDINKYENGVYYIPKKSKLNVDIGLSADIVARYKYVDNGKSVNGYYSGNTFANQIGITTQVPRIIEIVSNNASAKYREISISDRQFVLRNSPLLIDSNNVYVLQLLDLLKNIDFYIDGNFKDAKPKVYDYIKAHNITKDMVDFYIRNFPVSVFKNYYELELDNHFLYNKKY